MTARKAYLQFVASLTGPRARCASCGATAAQVGQARLHVHHLMHVAQLGVHDPAVMDKGNSLTVCNSCHALFHSGLRRYDLGAWQQAGRKRGRALR
jgi:hypothetical protein